MSVLHGQERARLRVALRASPVPGQLQKRRTGRYLLDGIAYRGIVQVPADPALETAIVTEPGVLLTTFGIRHATSDQ
jgi:hypothetical protein